MLYIIEAVLICFFVGVGCFQWGKHKAEDEAFVKKSKEEQEKQDKSCVERKLNEERYLEKEKEKKKNFQIIKNCLKEFNLPNNKCYIVGLYAMLEDRYISIPDKKYIKQYIKQKFIKKNRK